MNSGWTFKAGPSQTLPTGRTQQPSIAGELLRGNADALDRIHPQLGPVLLGLSCILLVFGVWLKRKEKPRKGGDDYAGVC